MRGPGPAVISCPTCGRTEVDVALIAGHVEDELERYYVENPQAPRPLVAVMGCMINGPGEARDADIALVGGSRKFALYVRGHSVGAFPEPEAVAALLDRVRQWPG